MTSSYVQYGGILVTRLIIRLWSIFLLSGIETIGTFKHGDIHHKHPGVQSEILFSYQLFAAV